MAYAVSSSRMVLAVWNNEASHWRGEAFSLRAPYPHVPWRVPSFNGIQGTCGTVTAWNGITMDALSGRPIGTAAWPFVICNESGTVRAEADAATSDGNRSDALRIGRLRIWVPDLVNLAISPRGNYLAWVSDQSSWPVCVERLQEKAFPECSPPPIGVAQGVNGVRQPKEQVMGISVTNHGAVITSAQNIWLTCDLCQNVYWWRPGMAEPALLQKQANGPQWVTRSAAQALIARYRYLRKQKRAKAKPRR